MGPACFPQGLLGGPETANPLPNAADLLVWCSPPIVPPNLPPRGQGCRPHPDSSHPRGPGGGSLLKMGWRGRLLADALHGNPRVLWGAGAGWGLLRNWRMASRAGGLGPQCAPPDCLRSRLGGQTPSEPLQGAPPDPLTESHVRPGHLVGAPQLTPCCLVVQPRSGPGPHHTEGPCCGPQSWAAGPRVRQALWRGVCEEHPELP